MAFEVLLAHSADWLGVSRLPRLFRRAGARTTVLAGPDTLVAATRYADELVPLEGGPETAVAVLRRVLEARRFDLVVVADDPLLCAIGARAGDDPVLRRALPVAPDRLSLICSKFAFLAAARGAGMPVPPSSIATSLEAAGALAEGFGFPVVLKRDAGTGGEGVRRVDDLAALRRAWFALGGGALIVEAFVEGLQGGCEALFRDGVPIAWWSFVKEQRHPALGPSTLRRVVEPPAIAAVLADYGQLTGLHGFVAMCWIFDPGSGRFAVLEFNPRPGSGMHARPGAEALFAEGLRRLVHGGPPVMRRPAVGRVYRLFPQELERALASADLVAAAEACASADLPWSDPGLLGKQLRYLAHERCPQLLAAVGRYRNGPRLRHKGA